MNIAGSSHLAEAEGYQRQDVPSPLQRPPRLFLRTVSVPVINACTGTDLERLTRCVCSENNHKEAGKRKILHQWAIKICTVKVYVTEIMIQKVCLKNKKGLQFSGR